MKIVHSVTFHSCVGMLPEVFYQLHMMLFFVCPEKSRHGKPHLYADEQPDGRGFSKIFYFCKVRQWILDELDFQEFIVQNPP